MKFNQKNPSYKSYFVFVLLKFLNLGENFPILEKIFIIF
jgi:hypothetical protein